MKIKISSISSEENFASLNRVYTKLEDALNLYIINKNFGNIDYFTIVIISSGEGAERIKYHVKRADGSGSFLDPHEKKRMKYISVAVVYSPDEVALQDPSILCEQLCDAVGARLSSEYLKIAKDFDYRNFFDEISLALLIFKKAFVKDA